MTNKGESAAEVFPDFSLFYIAQTVKSFSRIYTETADQEVSLNDQSMNKHPPWALNPVVKQQTTCSTACHDS